LRALDLFCCAGGATRGLQLAGFHVTGIDIEPQPHYCGDRFIQGDALQPPVDLRSFDFIWASPPCQAFTPLRALHRHREYPNLIPQTREMLSAAGVQFSIENVEGAPLGGNLIVLCGTMFGLQTPDGSAEIRRHRLFETSFSIPLRPRCQHGHESLSVTGSGLDSNREAWARRSPRSVITVVGPKGMPGLSHARRRAISVTGATPQTNLVTNRIRRTFSVDEARAAMGIDWMPMRWLSQAIPPAYAQFIGEQAVAHINFSDPQKKESQAC
jgi:DNA (cytosine-5)-methyltransferase 1